MSQSNISSLLKKPFHLSEEKLFLEGLTSIQKKHSYHIFLVGGFLRDYLLGRVCQDLDFAVSQSAIAFGRQFANTIKGAFVLLDKDHGCARVVKQYKGKNFTFDFADFRAKSIKKDLYHRDFTINTLAVDITQLDRGRALKDILIDPYGGTDDLRKKRIHVVSSKSFAEDALRVLRAFSLRALLGFTITRETLRQIKAHKDGLLAIAAERIRDELFKIFSTSVSGKIIRQMDRVGVLELILPQITVMYNVQQGTYHHLDVWPHSLETLDQLDKLLLCEEKNEDIREYLSEYLGGNRSRWALLKLAALLHDIGKPQTRKREGGRLTFHGHERVGQLITRKVAKMLKLSTRERHALEDMVLLHLRPGYLSNFKKPSQRAVFRFLRDAKEEAISILLLSLADQRATRGPLTTKKDQVHHEKIIRQIIETCIENKKKKPFVRLIDGYDLIRELKLTPSPLFSVILKEIEENQVVGKIKTKAEALALAKKIAERAQKK